MNQVSAKLRRVAQGYAHWCPGCNNAHVLPDSWKFDGNLDAPTFTPSFKHTGGRMGSEFVCHYILTAGSLHFCTDSMHSLAGKVVPLPLLPEQMTDPGYGQ